MNTDKLTFQSTPRRDECHRHFNKWFWDLEEKSRVPVVVARESYVEGFYKGYELGLKAGASIKGEQ